VDHASGLIWITHQVSLRAGETILMKRNFERFAHSFGIKVKKYHSDNGIFASDEFKEEARLQEQETDFSGVGAHHQNGVAERAIKTITSWARTMLLHSAIHWPAQSGDMLCLWPYAMDQAVFLWNNLPSKENGLSPLEIFSQQKVSTDYEHLRRAHVWGCPVYVLDPKLQDGKKLPKWTPQSRRGMFLGHSSDHSTSIGRILNLVTGKITTQFHVVYDDFFTTVPNVDATRTQEQIEATIPWDDFIPQNAERYIEDEVDDNGNEIPLPQLEEEWLTDEEINDRRQQRENRNEPVGRVRANDAPAVPLNVQPPPPQQQQQQQQPQQVQQQPEVEAIEIPPPPPQIEPQAAPPVLPNTRNSSISK